MSFMFLEALPCTEETSSANCIHVYATTAKDNKPTAKQTQHIPWASKIQILNFQRKETDSQTVVKEFWENLFRKRG